MKQCLCILPLMFSVFTLHAEVQVYGVVSDESGAPVTSASVYFIAQTAGDTAAAVTDKSGRYRLTLNLAPSAVRRSMSGLTDYRLLPNYPNPFNPSTIIPVDLAKEERISLAVYNVRGEQVAELFHGTLPAGRHLFHWDGAGAPAGIYFCRLMAQEGRETIKMVLADGGHAAVSLPTALAKSAVQQIFTIVVQKEALIHTVDEGFLIDDKLNEVEKNLTLPELKTLAAVNRRVGYQTIEGFGGYGGFANWYNSPEFVDLLLNDLGLTLLRTNVPPSLEAVNDDQDPHHFNWEGFSIQAGGDESLSRRIDYLKAMTARGDVKIISSVWSPPGWMKKSGQTAGKREDAPDPYSTDCALRDGMFQEFAEFICAYLLLMKRVVGIEVYAISLQNEPAFEEPYDSCVYSPEKLANLIAVVGERMEREGLTTKIFTPEDLGYHARVMSFVKAGMNNAAARKYIGANAVHGYALDGKTGQGYQANQWRELYEAGAPYGIPLWMTETSGYSNDWQGALKMAQSIHFALYYGRISAWLHWSLSVPENNPAAFPYGLILGRDIKTARYNVSKQYYKFIRPGMVQRQSSSFDEDVLIVSFQDPATDRWAIVLINRGKPIKKIRLMGEGLPQSFTMYRTSAYENCFRIGSVALSEPINLLGESISTLVNE
ncbi:MAG: T9SS type A sorting domain-containing protein [candidate division KSB1 bacterium]|nr:T9SS type A sorting domain-containing protein [candidate division KSB1 bacterium]